MRSESVRAVLAFSLVFLSSMSFSARADSVQAHIAYPNSTYLIDYGFEEADGSVAYDSTGNGFHGAESGVSHELTENGRAGGFSIAQTSRVELNGSLFELLNSSDFTMEVWMKPSSNNDQSTVFNVGGQCQGGCFGWWVHLDGQGKIAMSVQKQNIVCPQPVVFGQWYNVVLIVDGNSTELFQDGQSCGGITNFSTPIKYYGDSAYLGLVSPSFAQFSQFEGLIDNFRLSLVNKTQTEGAGYIQGQYQEGLLEYTPETTTTTGTTAVTTTIQETTTTSSATTSESTTTEATTTTTGTSIPTTTQSTIDYGAMEQRIEQLETKVAALEGWKATIDSWKESVESAISDMLIRLALLEDAVFNNPTTTTITTTTTTTIAVTSTTAMTTSTIPTTVATTTTVQQTVCEGDLIGTYSFVSSGKVTCPAGGYSSCCVYETCVGKTVMLLPGQSYSRSCSHRWGADLYGSGAS
jgi:hypothetical protein